MRNPASLLIIAGFCLGRWNVADGLEQPAVIERVDPFERRHFDGQQVGPGASMDDFRLIQAVDGFSSALS
ncbi:hypothetical protein OKW49_008304 [Paraburkholderia youngii]